MTIIIIIFNVCHDLSVCCAHKGKTCTDENAYVDSEEPKNSPLTCLNRESNPQ